MTDPVISALANGNYVIAFADGNAGGVYTQTMDSNLLPIPGSLVQVDTSTTLNGYVGSGM
jgi:hypothetical protein